MNSCPIPTSPSAVVVTPAAAADWLEHRNLPDNRTLSDVIAKRYAETMRSGRWLLTHQGIAFDRDGFLIDGQHRLRGIVIAGVSVELFVIPDCDAATFAVLDNGHKRQAAHLLQLPYPKTIASAARYLGVLTGVIPISTHIQGGVYANSMDTDIILKVVDDWPELAHLVKDINACAAHTRINAPVHLAVLTQASRTRYQHLIPQWVEGVTTGAELTPTDARLHLRNRFGREYRLLNHEKGTAYNLVVKAWNGYATGKRVATLKVLDSEGVLTVVR